MLIKEKALFKKKLEITATDLIKKARNWFLFMQFFEHALIYFFWKVRNLIPILSFNLDLVN